MRKLKCIRGKSNACRFCDAQHLDCSLPVRNQAVPRVEQQSKRALAAQPLSTVQSPGGVPHRASSAQLLHDVVKQDLQLPPVEVCNEIVDLYFQILHDKQHALFHPPTFIRAQREGTAPPILVLAIITYTAR